MQVRLRGEEGKNEGVVFNENDIVTKLFSGKHGKVVIVQDDYHFWKDNTYVPGAGKPLWLSLDRPNTHHIFFDDHINNNPDDSIVCVRFREDSSRKFVSLSGEKIRQQHGMLICMSPHPSTLQRRIYQNKIQVHLWYVCML